MENSLDLTDFSIDELLALSESILERLSAADLKRIRDLAEEKRKEKLEDAKNEVLAEMKGKLEQLGLSFEQVMGEYGGRRRASQLPPKYISPNGEMWSGRGYPPQWIRGRYFRCVDMLFSGKVGYLFNAGHSVASITYPESLMSSPRPGYVIDLR
jgi:DNA-binding protein H-NS